MPFECLISGVQWVLQRRHERRQEGVFLHRNLTSHHPEDLELVVQSGRVFIVIDVQQPIRPGASSPTRRNNSMMLSP